MSPWCRARARWVGQLLIVLSAADYEVDYELYKQFGKDKSNPDPCFDKSKLQMVPLSKVAWWDEVRIYFTSTRLSLFIESVFSLYFCLFILFLCNYYRHIRSARLGQLGLESVQVNQMFLSILNVTLTVMLISRMENTQISSSQY
jgi:hypothetical protein